MSIVWNPETPAIDPRSVVESMPIEDLAYVVSQHHAFGYLDTEELPIRFVCPLCQYHDFNGGSATVEDAWTWYCTRCRGESRDRSYTRRTRYALERVVLEDLRFLMAACKMATEDAEARV
ncbi:MAG TPA: hypothetical protein VGV93_06685 [Acidimicrobiales bacterium]|nr:hypothetical protein [Acidimicrobiales bacterium]